MQGSNAVYQLVSPVAYHPYLAFLAYFDHARVIRHERADSNSHASADDGQEELTRTFRENARRFAQECARLKAENVSAAHLYPTGDAHEHFPPYLFSPITFGALGHSDDIGLVLLDNFVAATRLSAVSKGIEHSDVMLCPIVASVPREPKTHAIDLDKSVPIEHRRCSPDSCWPFCDLDAIVLANLASNNDTTDPMSPGFLRRSPLVVITSLKANMLALQPHGLALQQAVYQSIIDTVQFACLGLLSHTDSENEQLFVRDDVLTLRCALLEPQGAEDVALIIWSNNYTVSNTILAAVRALTLDDMHRAAPDVVAYAFSFSALHQMLAVSPTSEPSTTLRRLHEQEQPDIVNRILAAIGGNHIFMRTYSTLAFAHEVLLAEEVRRNITGVCEARVAFDVSCGHEREVADCYDTALHRTFAESVQLTDRRAGTANIKIAESTQGVLPGTHDLAANVFPNATMHRGTALIIPTTDLFRFLSLFFDEVHQRNQQRHREGSHSLATTETGFMDLTSSLTIRTPLVNDHYCQTLLPFLPGQGEMPRRIDWDRHRFGVDFFADLAHHVEDRLELTDLVAFRDELRELGCPSSLQYALANLFGEFLDCLSDPLRCEAVLDLYDPFAMVRRVLSRNGPAFPYFCGLATPWRRQSEQTQFFTAGAFRAFIDALHSAFTLRIQKSIPNYELRDTAFNMRSSASKLLAAMDVPLKCSFGVFRRAFAGPGADQDSAGFRQRFGAVTTVNTHQNTSVQCGSIIAVTEARTGSTHLSFHHMAVNMDIFHLYRPEQAYNFLHEVAHMCYDATRAGRRHWPLLRLSSDQPTPEGEGNAESRTEEIYADLLACLFVFGGSTREFGRFHGIGFSEVIGQSIHVDHDTSGGLFQLAILESLLRGFIVSEMVQSVNVGDDNLPVSAWPELHPVYCIGGRVSYERLYESLISYVVNAGAFYRLLVPFWKPEKDDDVSRMMRRRAQQIVKDLCKPKALAVLGKLWTMAMHTYLSYWKDAFDEGGAGGRENEDSLLAQLPRAVQQCVLEGRGLCRTAWRQEIVGRNRRDGLDCLYVIGCMTKEYIKRLVGQMDAEAIIFPSRIGEGMSARSGHAPRHARFMMEETHVPLYAVQPGARREKILAQISWIKTMWDMACQLRTRRLVEMSASD